MAQVPAPPLDHQSVPLVTQLLLKSLSGDPYTQKQAEGELLSLATRPGLASCLAEIAGNHAADHSARWLASTQLKNVVSTYWRTHHHGITPQEKAHLRAKFMQLIPEENGQIATQVALVFAKAARFDYPKEWPGLFTDLLGLVPSGDTLVIRRVYFILHHVLKELSSKRLAADQKNFAAIAHMLFDHIWSQWGSDTNVILTSLTPAISNPNHNPSLLLHFERWLILLKIMRRLILFGYPSDARTLQPVAAVGVCVPVMLQVADSLLSQRPKKPPRSQLIAMMDRGVLKLTKTLCQVQEAHPFSYYTSGMLQPSLDFCFNKLIALSDCEDRVLERFLVQCMVFLLAVTRCTLYKGKVGSTSGMSATASSDSASDTVLQSMAAEVQTLLAACWSPDRLSQCCAVLIDRLFVLTSKELDEWAENPEEYFHQLEEGAWQDNLRLCAENLYGSLLSLHRQAVAPLVVARLERYSGQCPPGVDPSQLSEPRVRGVPMAVLLKEAVYNAAAVGAYDLHDSLDYHNWLNSVLLQVLEAAA